MTKSKVFLYFCLSFIIGIFINSFFHFNLVLILIVLISGIAFISVFWKRKKAVVFGFCLIFLVTGIFWHQRAELSITNNQLSLRAVGPDGPEAILNDTGQEITLFGKICAEPDIREHNTKLTIKVMEIKSRENRSREIKKGKVLLTTGKYPEYNYGDELKITGKLKTPQEFEDFNYKNYLAKDGIYSVMYYPEICRDPTSATCRGRVSALSMAYAKIFGFKDKLRNSIYQNLSPPQSSILGSMILGDKRKISEEWKEKLNIAGVRHITCISGMHIIILSGILMFTGIGLGLWRNQAFYFTIGLLILFIIMVGAPPSAIRAGIMGGMLLFAQKIGRLRAADRAIVFAATAMLVFNPLLLRWDVGFQLSFLATLGIIYLMPIFQNWFTFHHFSVKNGGGYIKKLFSPVKGLLAMTFAAQIFTLPILIYNFGYMSQIAPLTNILIVPLLPYIMVLGFIFGLAGILWQPLGWIFSWPAWLLLTYITKLVDWFSGFSWASLTIENIHWTWLIVAYLTLGFITWHLHQKQKLNFLEY